MCEKSIRNKMKNNTLAFCDDKFNELSSDFLATKIKRLTIEKNDYINIALSGGSTPIPILNLLKREKIEWSKIRFFMVDERCVPLKNDSSNYSNISKIFFKDISSQNFSMVKENFSYQLLAENYEQKLEKLPITENGFPQFDLILLGMGEDGHTASLFPNTTALLENKKWVVLNEVPQLKTERITLTYPVILNAKEIIVLVKGNRKKEIINQIYQEGINCYPMERIAREHSNLTWVIEE